MTICTENREDILGEIKNKDMELNEFGETVDKTIKNFSESQNIFVDTYCVMPNHVHLILVIVGAGLCASPNTMNSNEFRSTRMPLGSTQRSTPTLGEYIKRLKTMTTFVYSENVKKNNWIPFNKRVWQRNYYEHIIRSEKESNQIRQYIHDNPMNWEMDTEKI